MRTLGHKSIRDTLTHVQLEEAIFSRDEDGYVCKAAGTVKEASELFELGFEYICLVEGVKLFRKRK